MAMFAALVAISCSRANVIIGRVYANDNLTDIMKTEIVEEVKSVSPKHCKWKHNDGISSP